MRFIKDGPNIPLDVIQELEEGRLAIICGAGISRKAGLPSFKGLVKKLIGKLGADLDSIEDQELNSKNYDRVIGLLERENRFGPELVRKSIQKILKTPLKANLSTHESILKLATLKNNETRLITTNFDTLFEEVKPNIRTDCAPTLPPPKQHKWNSLVHLHGKIDKDDPFGKNLVLTSSDFGTAYLTERWASRFVTDLFNYFTVLFIGYSLSDPVMRYLVDALAVERKDDRRIKKAYALVDFENEKGLQKVKEKWTAKNIIPIPYQSDAPHSKLHETLDKWSRVYEGGVTSKQDIVKKVAPNDPKSLSIDQIDQLCWAIFDSKTSSYAEQFSKITPAPPLNWLKTFEERDRLKNRIKLKTNHFLVGHVQVKQPPYLIETDIAIGEWLTNFLNEKEFVDWIIDRGGHLHPKLSEKINRKLLYETDKIEEPFRPVWSLLVSDDKYSEKYRYYDYTQFKNQEWNETTRQSLLKFLDPKIELRKYINWGFDEDDESEIKRTSQLVRGEIKLVLGSRIPSFIRDLRNRIDWSDILENISFSLVEHLRKAMELLEIAGVVSKENDHSYLHHPSIRPHKQNRYFQDHTNLIDLLREVIDHWSDKETNEGNIFFEYLCIQPYPVFKRLAIYASEKMGGIQRDYIFQKMVNDPGTWLWDFNIRKEVYELLPKLWDELQTDIKEELFRLIEKGPSPELFRKDLEKDELNEAIDRYRWSFLIRIKVNSEKGLKKKGNDLINSLEEKHEFQYEGSEKEDFLSWSESGSVGYKSDYTADELKELAIDERVDILLHHEKNRRGLHNDWRNFCSKFPDLALETLEKMVKDGKFNGEIYSHFFYGLELKDIDLSRVFNLVDRIETNDLKTIIHSVSKNIQSIAEKYENVPLKQFFKVWDKLFPMTIESTSSLENADILNKAINHPAGYLTYSLIMVLNTYKLGKEDSLPEDIRLRFEAIIDSKHESANLAKVILGRYLPFLLSIDQVWVANKLIPLFDWSNANSSIFAWQGYLWSPSVNIELWQYIKPHYKEAFEYIDELSGGSKNLGQILALVYMLDEYDISDSEVTNLLKLLSDEDRAEFIKWIEIYLENTEEKEQEIIWSERVLKLFNDIWPKERKYKSETLTNKIFTILFFSHDAFSEAVKSVLPVIVPISDNTWHLGNFVESDYTEKFPKETLELINKATPENPPRWYGKLDEVLNKIAESEPDLKKEPHFKRLKRIVIENNIK